MSTDPKNPKIPRIDGLNTDFTKLREKANAEEGKIYVITETAAQLANQLSIDYPRLVKNEKIIITGLKGMLDEIRQLNKSNLVQSAVASVSGGQNVLLTLQMAITQLIGALSQSSKLSDNVISLMQDISQGHEYKIH